MKKIRTRLLIGFERNWVAWLETTVVALFSIWVWNKNGAVSIDTVLGSETSFFWPLFGPMLISIRYGFANGVICGLMVIAGVASSLQLDENLQNFSFSLSVGMILTLMIVGEFRDHWHEINQKFNLDHDYMRQKLESFTKNYHLLKVSHDQLEHRIAGERVSLRASVNRLQEIALKNTENRFENMRSAFLNIIAEIVGLEVAGIYRIKNDQIDKNDHAVISEHHALDLKDPMLKDMMETKKLLTAAKIGKDEIHKSRYQVCIPLLDTADNLQAIAVAEKVKFFMLTPSNIALLSLVSNFAADLLNEHLQVPVLNAQQKHLFEQYMKRAEENRRQFGADTSLVVFVGFPPKYRKALQEVISFRRGADVYWHCFTKEKEPVLVVLLPLTTIWGAQQYVTRIKELLIQSLGDFPITISALEKEVDILGPLMLGKDKKFISSFVQELGN